jgi:hypothetical protein
VADDKKATRSGAAVASPGRAAIAILPWFALFAGFLIAYAWIRRDWVWIVGDDQNLMMPAIDIGRGFVPNIDFVNGYPGLTFYVQRAIMLLVGDQPISEHVYTALQSALFALVTAWVLRRYFPAALTWLLIFFVWTVTHRLNPTPNPGFVMESLAILSLYWMDRFASRQRLRDAMVAGGLAGLAFLFKQPGIFLPVVFLIFTSYAYLAWPDKRPSGRARAAVIGLNVAALLGFAWIYLGVSVFGVLSDPVTSQALIFSSVIFLGPWAAAVVGLVLVPGRIEPTIGSSWSIRLGAVANLTFAAGFVLITAVGFVAIYGSPDRIAAALRIALFDSPELINSAQSKVLQPLLLWPTVAIAVLVILCPFAIGAVRSWPIRLVIFGAACWGCAYTALTYSDLQFTIVGTLLIVAMAAIFWYRRPTDRASWNRFYIFLGGTCLLAYLVPHPKYTFSLGILAVSGWYMLGSAAPQRWPTTVNIAGFGIMLAIALMTLRWANAEAMFITQFQVGTHTVRSYDSAFPNAAAAANASSLEDWTLERYDYLVYLAHAP